MRMTDIQYEGRWMGPLKGHPSVRMKIHMRTLTQMWNCGYWCFYVIM